MLELCSNFLSVTISVGELCLCLCIVASSLLLLRIASLARPLLTEWWLAGSRRSENIAIVGASLSGLSLAKRAADSGFRVVLFEKKQHSHGIWSTKDGSANDWSRLQVDHCAYCDLRDVPDCTSYYPGGDEIRKFLTRKAKDLVRTGRVEIRYGCEVRKIVDVGPAGGVLIEYEDLTRDDQNTVRKETFSSVHVRTGTIGRPRRLDLPGLKRHYRGRHCQGIANAIDEMPVRNKRVCIVGMGAFAIENAKRAIEMGAQSVTLIARSDSHVLPLYVQHYCTTNFLQLKVVEAEMDVLWKNLRQLLRCAPKTKTYDLEDIVVNCNDRSHYKMDSSSQSDWFYAALAYGAITVLRGRVIRCESSDRIVAQSPDGEQRHVLADVVIDCTGHDCDTSLLAGIPLTTTMFAMNGKLTHNIGLDTRPKPILFGPRCDIPTFPPGGYGILCDLLDIVTMCSISDERFYQKWTRASIIYQYPEISFIEKVNTVSWIRFMWKSMAVGFPEIACRMVGAVYDRYQVCLALENSGNGWYEGAVADWRKYLATLNEWKQRQDGSSSEEKKAFDDEDCQLLPYPWPAPSPLQPLPVGRLVYQLILFVVCVIGFERCVEFSTVLPIM